MIFIRCYFDLKPLRKYFANPRRLWRISDHMTDEEAYSVPSWDASAPPNILIKLEKTDYDKVQRHRYRKLTKRRWWID